MQGQKRSKPNAPTAALAQYSMARVLVLDCVRFYMRTDTHNKLHEEKATRHIALGRPAIWGLLESILWPSQAHLASFWGNLVAFLGQFVVRLELFGATLGPFCAISEQA